MARLQADLANVGDRVERVLFDLRLKEPLSADLQQLQEAVGDLFDNAPDITAQRFRCRGGLAGLAVWETTSVDDGLLASTVLDRLADASLAAADGFAPDLLDRIGEGVVPSGTRSRVENLGQLGEEVLGGAVIVAFAGCRTAMAIQVEKLEQRKIERPIGEPLVLGPHESFIESGRTNISLVRRRLRTPRLRIQELHIGTISRTPVYVLHIHGVADDRLVREAERRLRRIRIDGIVDAGQIKEQIRDTPSSPFPTAQRTERPDRVAAGLLEGRVAILTDGSPFAILAPATFTGLMKASEDYYLHWIIATAVRSVRWTALLLGLFLPPFYVAVTTYHQELIPAPLLLTIAASRENVPLPTLAEVGVLMVLFEIIREASVRVPLGIGNALTIGGTLVVGESAVRAGIVAAPTIIVTATVVIAFFTIPNYELVQVSRLVLYPLLVAAGLLGIYGLFFALIIGFLHVASLRSFGVPYLDPVAPLRPANWHDFILRAPWFAMRRRPLATGYPDPVRAGRRPPLQIRRSRP